MTYEIYNGIFIGATIFSIIMFIISVIVFVKFQIATVIGDLTGLNARRGIKAIRERDGLPEDNVSDSKKPKAAETPKSMPVTSQPMVNSVSTVSPNNQWNQMNPVVSAANADDKTDLLVKRDTDLLHDDSETERLVQVPMEQAMFKVERDITYMFSKDVISRDLGLRAHS